MSRILEFPERGADPRRSSLSPTSPAQLWRRVDLFAAVLDIPESRLHGYLGMTAGEIARARSSAESPSVPALERLCQSVGTTLGAFFDESVDLKALARHNLGDTQYLPERYSAGALSRRFTVERILSYIEATFGLEKRARMLKRFHLNESHFADLTQLVNVRLAIDLLASLHAERGSMEIVRAVGRHSSAAPQHSPLAAVFREQKSVEAMYECMVESLVGKYMERNFRWRFEQPAPDYCLISGRPTEEALDTVGSQVMSNVHLSVIRQGILETIPRYVGLPDASVRLLTCLSQGYQECVFRIDLSRPEYRRFRSSGGLDQAASAGTTGADSFRSSIRASQ